MLFIPCNKKAETSTHDPEENIFLYTKLSFNQDVQGVFQLHKEIGHNPNTNSNIT
jgi:hypothetical protein